MKIKTLYLIVIAIIINQNIIAETPLKSKLSIGFGIRDMWHTPNSTTNNQPIDLINYFEYTGIYPAYEYLEIAEHHWWNSKFETDIKIAVDPVFSPNYLYLKGIFKFKKNLGFSAMYIALPQSLRLYKVFESFEPVVNTYIKQTDGKVIYNYEHCFGAGIYVPIDYDFFHINFSLNFCTGLSPGYNRTVQLNSYSTNYKAIYDYNVKSTISFFILPELEFNFEIVTIGKGSLGFQFKSNWMQTQKTIPYKLNKMEWTKDNSIELNVKPVPQKITKFELDGGIYFRW